MAVKYDVPRTVTGWKIIADNFESKWSMLNRRKFHGSVGLGFTWASDQPERHEIAATWKAVATHILPRLIEGSDIRMTDSRIIQATAGPKLRLRVEGD